MMKISALSTALQYMGFKSHMIETSEELMELKGYAGDMRSQKAHVRIKGAGWRGQNYVGGASNDLGWERNEDGSLSFHVSDYDRTKHNSAWQDKLAQQYSRAVIEEQVTENGWELEQVEETEEGFLRLVINNPY